MDEKKVAVIAANGCEEGETLTIVDILRRGGFSCEIVGLQERITGQQGIIFEADKILDENLLDYDMIVIPGGYGGAQNIRDHSLFISLLKQAAANHKYIASMCAGPIVLEKAGLLDGKNYTAYVGYDQKIKTGNYKEDIVVVDGSLITSRGPATVYAFAYKLVEILGGDAEAIKKRMAYFNAFNVK